MPGHDRITTRISKGLSKEGLVLFAYVFRKFSYLKHVPANGKNLKSSWSLMWENKLKRYYSFYYVQSVWKIDNWETKTADLEMKITRKFGFQNK